MSALMTSVMVFWGCAGTGIGLQAPQEPDYQRDCASAGCHEEYGKRPFVHGPVASGSCDACHEKVGRQGHKFRLIALKADLCVECHDKFEGTSMHAPVTEGQCTVCHDSHGSATRHLLRAPTAAESCTGCHRDVTERKFLHGPVAAGACTVCHQPHAADHSALLVDEPRKVCLNCHTTMGARIADLTNKHAPATEDCVACHDAHGGDSQMNLKSAPPKLCLECHDGIADILGEATVKHDAVTTGTSCVGCHEPHASSVERILLQEPIRMCLSCHDTELDSGGQKIGDIATMLTENPSHHGPIRQGNCTGCHAEVHGGEHFRLLLGEYPPEFYAPFEERRYAFCFKCHEPDVVRDQLTDSLTNFRNGDQNLHHLHVNRPTKGRTCRACHSTHASRRPKHVTESVPFGSWEIPINFEKKPAGGLCLPGCHRLYTYDRDTPVNNVPP